MQALTLASPQQQGVFVCWWQSCEWNDFWILFKEILELYCFLKQYTFLWLFVFKIWQITYSLDGVKSFWCHDNIIFTLRRPRLVYIIQKLNPNKWMKEQINEQTNKQIKLHRIKLNNYLILTPPDSPTTQILKNNIYLFFTKHCRCSTRLRS